MKIDPDKSPIAGFGDLLEVSNFETDLPPSAALKAAYGDPSAAYALDRNRLGKDIVVTGVRAFRFVGARVGVDLGVPVGMLDHFFDSVSVKGYDQAVTQWATFAISTAQKAIIDLAVDAMGAVPIVGWIAKAASALIDGIMAAAQAKRVYPPMLEYDETLDVFYARKRIGDLANLDWTSTWMPQYMPTKASDWETVQQETSFLFHCRGDVENGANQGAIPGGTLGSRGVQSRNCWGWVESGIGIGTDADKADRIYLENQREITECIFDVWDTTPSVARVCLAAWQQMTAKQTATIWNCDTRDIVRAWQDYCESAIEYSRINTRGTVGDPFRWLALKNLARAMFVRHWSTPGVHDASGANEFTPTAPARQPRLDQVASLYIKDLRKRQYAAAKTKLVAYAQLEQGAFADVTLRRAMIRERAELLNGAIRWTIDPKDVIDPEYRKLLKESFVGASPPQRTPPDDRGDPSSIPDAEGFLRPDLAPGSGAGGLALLALVLGAAFLL